MKILIAVDGSKSSECATKELRRLDLGDEDEILLFGVVEIPSAIMAEPLAGIAMEYQAEVERESRRIAQQSLDEAAAEIGARFTGKLSTQIQSGSPKYAITDKAKEWGADLIIIGSHGYSIIGRILLGSVSSYVSHHSECSVLIARCR